MRVNAYLTGTGILFAVIGGAHVLRLLYGWPVTLGAWQVPLWVSWVGAALAFALCVWAIALRRSRA
jgi:hypothetical protein